jgi:Protein of unknown function (DUF3592)
MFGRKQLTLSGGLLLFLFALGIFAIQLLSDTSLLWHGVTTQGVIVDEQATSCWKRGTKNILSVAFTDQTGLVHTRTISQCDYEGFNASPGDSVTIVYLPNDPTVFAPPDGLLDHIQVDLILTILLGLITLFLLPLWIREQIRKASLSRQEKLEAQRNAQEFDRKLEEALKQADRNPEGDI